MITTIVKLSCDNCGVQFRDVTLIDDRTALRRDGEMLRESARAEGWRYLRPSLTKGLGDYCRSCSEIVAAM